MKAQSLELQFCEIQELDGVASQLLGLGASVPVWLFRGEMGVGKTTLIKKLCELLEVKSLVQSPTFSIINEYRTRQGTRVYHFDFYRLKNESEAYDIGTEEYLYSGDRCFIEWPDKIESLWPDSYLDIQMKLAEDTTRLLTASVITAHSISTDRK